MSAKIFIKGDYRHFFIDNSNITDYKVFYDNVYVFVTESSPI